MISSNENKKSQNGEGTPLLAVHENSVGIDHAGRSLGSVTRSVSFGRHDSLSSRVERLLHWTDSQREDALDHPGVGQAAFLLRDAILGNVEIMQTSGAYNPYCHDDEEHYWRNEISIICRRILHLRSIQNMLQFAAWTLVLISFIEPPYWCRFDDLPGAVQDEDEVVNHQWEVGNCHAFFSRTGPPVDDPTSTKNVEYYPYSGSILLTIGQSLIVECICVAVIVMVLLLRIGRDGTSLAIYLRSRDTGDFNICLVRSIQAIATFALLLGMVGNMTWSHHRPFALFWRITIFITLHKGVQRELATTYKLIGEIGRALFLLIVVIAFYGWIGVVAFSGFDEGFEHFSNLLEAMWSLWIMVTTANYPDVMMPAYNENRVVALYFVSFMIVTFFFMMNIILASVVNIYDNDLEQREKQRQKLATDNLKAAFELLDPDHKDCIDKETVMAIFCVLNQDFPDIRRIPDDEAKLLFAILDKDGSERINEEEFMDFGNVLLLEFEKSSAYETMVERYFPSFFASEGYQAFRKAILSENFEILIDVILVLNAVAVVIQSWSNITGQPIEEDPHFKDGTIDTFWEGVEAGFTAIYVVEMFVKMLVLGWRSYIESLRNIFDAIITCLSVFATAYVYYPNDFSDSRLIRFIVMARVLRLTRLLVALRPFQVIGSVCVDVLPAASRVLLLLFCIMYVFAAMGMQFFGGMITRDPNNPLTFLLLDNDFSDNEYWANNFNDMFSGFNVLFNLLVVNNWTEFADGIEAVTESKLCRLFFLAFHITGVITVNNLVVAFIINSFVSQWEIQRSRKASEEDTGDAIISEKRARFDATEVTGTKTDLSGGYVARMRRTPRTAAREVALLKKLFTRSSSNVNGNSERSVNKTDPPKN